MDIAKLSTATLSDQGVEVDIYVPGTSTVAFTAVVRGQDSAEYRRVRDEMLIKAANRARDRKRTANTEKDVTEADIREREENEALLVAALIKETRGFEWDGREFDLGSDHDFAVMLLADRGYQWIRGQIEAAGYDRTRFFDRSAIG